MVGCSKDKTIASVTLDTDALPAIHAEGISSLISDSGITRYRLQTEVWNMYEGSEPYWHFPEGIYLEQFDSLFNVIGNIKADTAYFFEKPELWQLIGNVFIQNLEGHTFETSELFWSQKEPASSRNSIYTDQYIRIDQGDRIITGEGLRSNQSMSSYYIVNVSAEAWINEKSESEKSEEEETPTP